MKIKHTQKQVSKQDLIKWLRHEIKDARENARYDAVIAFNFLLKDLGEKGYMETL
jgi:hypothetical protein